MSRIVSQRWFSSTVLGIGLVSLFSDLSHEAVTSLLPTGTFLILTRRQEHWA